MKPFRISKLEINNIGPFGNLVLDFPEKPASARDKAEIHILTGENGTGKSTVLEILTVGLQKVSDVLYGKSRFDDSQSFFELSFNNQEKSRWNSERGRFSTKNWTVLTVLKQYQDNYKSWRKQSFYAPFSIAFFTYSGYRKFAQADISDIRELTHNPFKSALDFQTSINHQWFIQWIANTITKEILALNQEDIKQAARFRKSISGLEKAISEIIEKPIKFTLEYAPFKVKIQVENENLDFDQLPDGLKSIISWLSDLLMRMDRVKWVNDTPVFERNFLLFLDEIEVHLHPAWQRKILPAVQSLFPNAQIFVSTHSPFVVGSVDGAWIHKLVKPNGDTKLASPPILSEDSRSVSYWLKEVFDVKEEFGQAAQQDLDKFYELRNALLVNGTPEQRNDFKTITNALLNQNSQETETIIGFELRQLNKRLAEPIQL